LLKEHDNWCVDIYRGIFIDRFNDTHVKIAPCCQAGAVVESLDTFEFSNSNHLTALRNKFDQGEKPKECNRCWHDEQLGQNSRRINISANQAPDTTVELENVTYHSTWACNLACVMCNAGYSSTWAQELNTDSNTLEKIGRKFNKSKKILDQLDFSKVKRIHFNGGEPLLNNEHQTVLEKFDDIGILSSTNLSYNTNGTQYPSTKTLELWSQAQQVLLWFSIDGIQDSFEYIRYPGNWLQTSMNLIRIKNTMPNNVKFGFNVTVGCYNVFEIADVLDWVSINFPTADFGSQIAYNFDPKSLNIVAKNAAIDHLQNYKEFSGIVTHLIDTMNIENSEWINALGTIDRRRGTNWKQSLRVSEFY
jgi:sulfatase maturation enzyme AslB (radical SAM superfamily)